MVFSVIGTGSGAAGHALYMVLYISLSISRGSVLVTDENLLLYLERVFRNIDELPITLLTARVK